jgi:hypothetical protein
MAEVHGNRTHLPPCSDGTLDLKSRRATSALSTSAQEFSICKIRGLVEVEFFQNMLTTERTESTGRGRIFSGF